jgi:hypothetical protein
VYIIQTKDLLDALHCLAPGTLGLLNVMLNEKENLHSSSHRILGGTVFLHFGNNFEQYQDTRPSIHGPPLRTIQLDL